MRALLVAILLLVGYSTTFSGSNFFKAEERDSKNEERILNVYTSRQEDLIRPILDEFAEQTQIEVNLLSAKADVLVERLVREGASSRADLLITVDVARLVRAKNLDLLQAIDNAEVLEAVPNHLRDPERKWVGLSLRSRVFAYNPDTVDPDRLNSYLDLARPEWKGRVCMRSSNNVYNQSLLASIIYHYGDKVALDWAKGVVDNLLQEPTGNDRSQLNLIASGICDVSLINNYYMGLWLEANEGAKLKRQPRLLFPEQGEKQVGSHINISGAGIVKYSRHVSLAQELLAYLVSKEGQKQYCYVNNEYPIRNDLEPSEAVKSLYWPVKFDRLDIGQLGALNKKAVEIFDNAGWK